MTELAIQPTHSSMLDDEIAALALQLEEVDLLEDNSFSKGKYPVGNPPDIKHAFDDFQAELLAHLNFLRDLRLAHSIACAVDADAQVIAELIAPEEQAQEDRRYAIRLQSTEPGTSTALADPMEELCLRTSKCAIELDDSDEESQAGPSRSYAERQAKAFCKLTEEHQCNVCYNNFRPVALITMPCGDRYCRECTRTLFINATTDETLFPPRCCRQPIPFVNVRNEFSDEEIRAFHSAEVEFETRDRTYCSNTTCGRFIPPDEIRGEKAQCSTCFTITCSLCKSESHDGYDCPADPSLQATLSLANEQGWKRCNSCRTMVELDHGCNHMTCHCGAQFCYVCGVDWKNCPCDQWNEARLFTRARQVVNRDLNPGLIGHEVNRRVEEMAEALRENHECGHFGWLPKVEGFGRQTFRCEMCSKRHSRFILRCPRCEMHICADCRRNRLR